MEDFFANPFWHALNTEQSSIALGSGLVRRYPADVIPFAAFEHANPETMIALRELLAPGEIIYVTGDHLPEIPGIAHTHELPGWQMHLAAEVPASEPTPVLVQSLTANDVPAMVALTDVAFPGFFRPRTYTLGLYFGIRVDGELVAMAGERIALPGFREISAVCTHPDHTGRGYAAILIRHLLKVHSEAGLRSFLHVVAANSRAIALYERLGFEKTSPIGFHQLRRSGLLPNRRNSVERGPRLVFRRHLHMVDDQNLHRPFHRFQLQPELFLNRREDRRPSLRRGRTTAPATHRRLAILRRPRQCDVIPSRDPGLVHHNAAQLPGQLLR